MWEKGLVWMKWKDIVDIDGLANCSKLCGGNSLEAWTELLKMDMEITYTILSYLLDLLMFPTLHGVDSHRQ